LPGVSETHVEIVRRCLTAVEAGDVDSVIQLLDADVVVTPSSELLTGSRGPYHGHAGARRWFAEAAAVQNLRFQPHEFLDFGDRVFVSGRQSVEREGHDQGQYGASVWRFDHGFIVEVRGYLDREDALRAARAPRAE
jgi:ketosteroid isomerase-like protein